ncbi:hypothetical protein [Allomuricauda sp. M10]|uniref:hypothetical protein n=1 Tax=Allomuricauda sp. M10 TaxID=2683292 RepID=UPI001D18F8BA|nr:hypothetical protein [Muricauda sp. M10]
MKKFRTSQIVIIAIGIIGGLIGIFGKFDGWDYNTYFPIFYSGTTMVWISFLPNKGCCCNLFKRKATQNS